MNIDVPLNKETKRRLPGLWALYTVENGIASSLKEKKMKERKKTPKRNFKNCVSKEKNKRNKRWKKK